MMTNRKNHGFTLVEILIVVVILGILAAIVIPQFSQASSEARESSLKSNLQAIRSQIELYRIQHNDILPAEGALETALTDQTDMSGSPDGSDDFGPYMNRIPVNPFTGTDVIGAASGAGVDWVYDVTGTGVTAIYDFLADDGLSSADGDPHSGY
jgi:general secretion pathway protein G